MPTTAVPDPTKQPPGGLLHSTERVEDELVRLTSQDSNLMQQARTSGAQQAQQRGLLNSSIAVGASEDAANRAALPIAQQDASQQFQRGQQTRQFGQEENLQGREFGQQTALQGREIEARSALSTQEAGQSQALARVQGDIQQANLVKEYEERGLLSSQEAQQQRDTIAAEYGLRSGLSAQEFDQAMQQQNDQQAANIELQRVSQEGAAQLQTMQQQHQTLLQTSATAAQIYSNLQSDIAAILANPQIKGPNKAAAINDLIATTQASLDLMSSLASAGGVNVTTQTIDTGAVGGTPAGTPGPAQAQPPNVPGDVIGQRRRGPDGTLYVWNPQQGGGNAWEPV